MYPMLMIASQSFPALVEDDIPRYRQSDVSSAAVANIFCRSIVASIFLIIARSFVNTLCRKWDVRTFIIHLLIFLETATDGTRVVVLTFAFISLGIVPISFVCIRLGPMLRLRSRHARQAPEAIARMHAQQEPAIKV